MNRRNFLAAALAAPWVVRSGVLMPVRKVVAASGAGWWGIYADGTAVFLEAVLRDDIAVRVFSRHVARRETLVGLRGCYVGTHIIEGRTRK